MGNAVSIGEAYEILSTTGIPQSEFWKMLGKDANTGARIVKRLTKRNLISRQSIMIGGRWTYLVRACPSLTLETLADCVQPEQRTTSLDFKEPNLTFRIKQAVELRVQGMTYAEIARIMKIQTGTVGMYLRYARNPERYFEERKKRTERSFKSRAEALTLVRDTLQQTGYVWSEETESLSTDDFRLLAEWCNARICQFPYQKKFFGSLSGTALVYVDKEKVAAFIARMIATQSIPLWTGRSKRGGGGYDSELSFRRALAYRLGGVISDKALCGLIRERLDWGRY